MNNKKIQEEKNNNLLLDSSLILATTLASKVSSLYDIKLVDCNDYTQIYFFENKGVKRKRDKDDFNLQKYEIDKMFHSETKQNDLKIPKKEKNNIKKTIDNKNIMRSRIICQRLAKCNIDSWKSFITLTFRDNIQDFDEAYKKYKNYVDKIRRVKKDFMYLVISEYQERGALHYHLLTNLECNTILIPKRETKKLYNPKTKKNKVLEYYDLKYWNEGFSSAEIITGDIKKIIGYISKYMSKNIDNRLFNHHRYFYSRNLKKPTINYLDLSNSKHIEFYKKYLKGKELVYKNEYILEYDKSNVIFLEFLKK